MIKKLFFALCCMVCTLAAHADWEGDGYYRVQNYASGRYAYVLDNHAKVNMQSTTVDLKAIELWKDKEKFLYSPSTIVYIKQVGSQYDILAQGTGVHDMIDQYVNLRKVGGDPAYSAYGTYSGVAKFLADPVFSSRDSSYMSDQRYPDYYNYSLWNIIPVSANSDNYMSIKPTVTCKGKYYATMFCDYSYSFVPQGMKAYYVSYVDGKRGLAIYNEITSGKVPTRTPVFIECPSEHYSGNKINVGVEGATPISDNRLGGVYFCKNNPPLHVNVTEFKTATMRLLGVLSDGSLGFNTPNEKYVPRNSAYLRVPEGTPAEVKLVTKAEYDYILAHEVIEAQSISLSSTSVSMLLGSTATLTATVSPENTTDKTVTWSTSNAAVATVSAAGVVSAVGLGTATITAKCGNVSASCEVTVNPIKAESVKLNYETYSLMVGQTATLTATVSPDNTTDKTVTWSSADASIVTVSASGVIKAVKVGTTTITARCGEASASCVVTVNPIPAEGIVLSTTSVELLIDESVKLAATVLPENATNKTVTWSSSSPAVATVDSNGNVKAIAAGEAVITATSGNVSATCNVKVNKYTQQIEWSQEIADLKVGDEVALTAKASSGLAVKYEIVQGLELATINNATLRILGAGEIKIKASQEGNARYEAAEPVFLVVSVVDAVSGVLARDIEVLSVDGGIVIVGAGDEVAQVYTVAGALVYSGTDRRIALRAGNYIVRIGASHFKVQVR